jgi:hypothetical protein
MAVAAYEAFLDEKAHSANRYGFAPRELPGFLFDFQAALVDWALRKGRGGMFADCGLGKTPMYLAWADAVVRRDEPAVLVLLPLAVAPQTLAEAEKFGIEAIRSSDGRVPARARVVLTNYERLHYFDADRFAGVVCDESSILKAFDGVRRGAITQFMRKRPYRLLCTATAAPNDYIELGTSSEALGELGLADVLARFFKNDLNNAATGRGYLGAENKWRFKGHAESRSGAGSRRGRVRCAVPPISGSPMIVSCCRRSRRSSTSSRPATRAEGMLLALPAAGLQEQREEQRRTIDERCDRVARLVADTGEPALVWCHLNDEGDRLEQLIPGAVQVSGSDPR